MQPGSSRGFKITLLYLKFDNVIQWKLRRSPYQHPSLAASGLKPHILQIVSIHSILALRGLLLLHRALNLYEPRMPKESNPGGNEAGPTADDELLHSLGYKQEFKREFTSFEVFGTGLLNLRGL